MIKVGLFSRSSASFNLSYIKPPNSSPTNGSCQRSWFSSSAIIQLNQVLPVLAEPNIQINCSVRTGLSKRGSAVPFSASSGDSSRRCREAFAVASASLLGTIVVLGELLTVLYWASMYLWCSHGFLSQLTGAP